MMLLLAEIVDVEALQQTVLASLAAGVGITLVFSIGLYGGVRAIDLRRAGRPVVASLAGILAILGMAASVAAIAVGLVVMTSK